MLQNTINIMDKLIELFRKKLANTNTDFVRSLLNQINWDARLIGIKGARGVGKTTLILQYIKLNFSDELDKVLYISLDNIYFSNNRLIELADNFAKKGGEYLFIDEVHKYEDWAKEIKNIYDDYPEIKIIFTGSSLLEILNSRTDLSRRAIMYNMQGLSFREYLEYEYGFSLKKYSLDNIIENHIDISQSLLSEIKPLKYLLLLFYVLSYLLIINLLLITFETE